MKQVTRADLQICLNLNGFKWIILRKLSYHWLGNAPLSILTNVYTDKYVRTGVVCNVDCCTRFKQLNVRCVVGRYSVADIAAPYGLEGPGTECRWWRDFSHPSRLALWPGLFPGIKWPSRGVERTPSSSAEVKEIVVIHLYSPFVPS